MLSLSPLCCFICPIPVHGACVCSVRGNRSQQHSLCCFFHSFCVYICVCALCPLLYILNSFEAVSQVDGSPELSNSPEQLFHFATSPQQFSCLLWLRPQHRENQSSVCHEPVGLTVYEFDSHPHSSVSASWAPLPHTPAYFRVSSSWAWTGSCLYSARRPC